MGHDGKGIQAGTPREVARWCRPTWFQATFDSMNFLVPGIHLGCRHRSVRAGTTCELPLSSADARSFAGSEAPSSKACAAWEPRKPGGGEVEMVCGEDRA